MEDLSREKQREQLIDDRFYEFGRRIAEFDPMIQDVRKTKEFFDSFVTRLHSQEDKQCSDYSELKASLASLQSHDDVSEIRFKNLFERLDNISEQHKQSKEDIKYSQSLYLIQLEKINCLAEKIADLDRLQHELRIFRSDISKEIKSISDEVKEFKKNVYDLNEDFISHQNQVKHFHGYEAQQDSFRKSVEEQISDVKDVCNGRYQTLVNFIESMSADLKAEFGYKLSCISIPKVDDFCHKDSVEKISSQIESLYLDAKNALLKSSNVEIQSQIQSKKIENIFLTLKNQELKA